MSRALNISAKVKHRKMAMLHIAQEGVCCHCGHLMISPAQARTERGSAPPRPNDPTLEHVTPRAVGGKNANGNLLLAHRRCNDARGVKPLSYAAHRMHEQVLAWLFVHQQSEFRLLDGVRQ